MQWVAVFIAYHFLQARHSKQFAISECITKFEFDQKCLYIRVHPTDSDVGKLSDFNNI